MKKEFNVQTDKSRESSIIEIIEKMVREGKSEEQIIKHLKALGIKPTQAKKLLLLGEADTFTLLRSEIKKIIKEDIEKEREMITNIVSSVIAEEGKKLEAKMDREIKLLRDAIAEKIQREETSTKKRERMKKLMHLLQEPKTTHGIKFEEIGKKKEKKGLHEVRL